MRTAARFGRRRISFRGQFVVGAALIIVMLAFSFIAPLISPYTPTQLAGAPLQPPSSHFWMGTDTLGRDVFTRLFAAAQLDILLIVLATAPPALGGALGGAAVAMTKRSWMSAGLMRVTDVAIAFPGVVLILFISVIIPSDTSWLGLPPGSASFLVAVYLVGWPLYARVAHAETRILRELDFIQATYVAGFSPWRRLTKHLLPAVLSSTGAIALSDSVAILATLAALPFLGAGVQPPVSEWGSMIYEARTQIEFAPWNLVFPAVAVVWTGIGFVFVGDSLISGKSRA